MNLFFLIYAFFLGSIFASFSSVIALRLKNHEEKHNIKSIFFGRSECPNCKISLPWWTLMPIISYFILRGKCHNCKKHISLIYPSIEIVTSIFVVMITSKFLNNDFDTFHYVIFLFTYFILLILSVQDIQYEEISDKIAIPAIIIIFFSQLAYSIHANNIGYFTSLLFITGILFFIFSTIVITTSGMGGGDIRVFIIMGLILSFPNILFALTISFILASIGGSIQAIFEKQKNIAKFHVRLIPYLAFGFSIILIWGNIISDLVLR